MKHWLIGIVIIVSCQNPSTTSAPTTNSTKTPKDTLGASDNLPETINSVDCVFDTSTYKFTTEAIKKYNPHLLFQWDTGRAVANFSLDNNDSLSLHIGGCNHFTYSAIYTTNSDLFNDDSALIATSKWIAKTFFKGGLDSDFLDILNKHDFVKETKPNLIVFNPVESDNLTNIIIEPILIEKREKKTVISLAGYMN